MDPYLNSENVFTLYRNAQSFLNFILMWIT